MDVIVKNDFVLVPILKKKRLAGMVNRDSIMDVYEESGI